MSKKINISGYILLLIIFFEILGTKLKAEEKCIMKGKWRSNEKATIEEIKRNTSISEERIKFIISKRIFGQLSVEFTCNEFTSHYEGNINRKKYKIIKKEGNFITIEYFDDTLGENTVDIIELDGDCYYVPIETYGFREVLCRVKD